MRTRVIMVTRADRPRRLPWLLPLLVLVPLTACDTLPLLAPTGSTIVLIASDPVIPLNGDSTITASVTEPAGTPARNGTSVTFSTTLGTLEPQEATSQDGRVTARLHAGNQSGTAMVTAFSGSTTSEAISVTFGGP